MTDLRDETMPDGRWEFDDEVTRVFDDMLARSIPQHQLMRETVFRVGDRFREGRPDPSAVPLLLDVGCSRGGAMAPFVERGWAALGLEASEPMVTAASERFTDDRAVTVRAFDLRTDSLPPAFFYNLVLCVLTLQFVPINHRQRIVADLHRALAPGGGLILVEKVLGRGAKVDALMVDLYHETKELAGYTREAVDRKALALEGVLVPVTADWNVDLLRGAGFAEVDCFWRWMNFAGWVAVKADS